MGSICLQLMRTSSISGGCVKPLTLFATAGGEDSICVSETCAPATRCMVAATHTLVETLVHSAPYNPVTLPPAIVH